MEAEAALRQIHYTLNYYEYLFPWLPELLGQDWRAIKEEEEQEGEEEGARQDPARRFLSPEEYARLSDTEKNQLALDRYNHSRKSAWQIGRHYERFIGYLFELDGWKVQFYGAVKRLEDLGRDLIVTKGNKTKIVQCKYWAQEKTIHEKHLYQLFGTTLDYAIENYPLFRDDLPSLLEYVSPVLVVSCSLSERARIAAKVLKITVREKMAIQEAWPQIKCNIGQDGERIFHLPFDQQYDRVIIDPGRGELYVGTVEEAVQQGFRRAMRWHGDKK